MRIDVTFKVVTPMFCGGVEPKHPAYPAELRLASFKGVLRFWWRALAWRLYDENLRVICQQESALFGSKGVGQSRVIMKLTPRDRPLEIASKGEKLVYSPTDKRVIGHGARYLGYGVIRTQDGRLEHSCLRAPFYFSVQMHCSDLDDVQIRCLVDSLKALGTLGGMGAKSRKGYGSLVIKSLRIGNREHWTAPADAIELGQKIAYLLNLGKEAACPAYTALSAHSCHLILPIGETEPLKLLNRVGLELKKSIREEMAGPDGVRRRIVFGLPRNFGRGGGEQVKPSGKDLDRRASPLFIHIHECGGSHVAVLSFLPSEFLPCGPNNKPPKILIGTKEAVLLPKRQLYQSIHKLFEHFTRLTAREGPSKKVIRIGQ